MSPAAARNGHAYSLYVCMFASTTVGDDDEDAGDEDAVGEDTDVDDEDATIHPVVPNAVDGVNATVGVRNSTANLGTSSFRV